MVRVFTLQLSTQNKKNKIKLLNRKLVIENEVMENEIQNEIKVKVKTKYWHKCRHCSRRHSTKIKWNKMKQNKIHKKNKKKYIRIK